MAAEADITEPISVMKREWESKELTSEPLDITVNKLSLEEMNKAEHWVNVPPEAIKFLDKSENMPVATNIDVENVNAVIKGNVRTIEGEIFLGSLSVTKVAHEETSRLADDYQAAEILNQAEKLVPKNETLREEKLEDQLVEIVANEEASPKENQQNTKEELRGSEKDEKGVTVSDEKTESESDEQTLEMLEATSGQNAGAMVQTPDLIKDLNMDIGKLREACDKVEITDNAFSAETASIEEGLREASFQGGEDKELETSSNSVGKEMDPEAVQLRKNIKDKKNGEEMPHEGTKDVCISETAGPDNEEEGIENSEGAKDKPGSPLVTALINETSSENAGRDVGGNLEENSSITFVERSQETVGSSEKKQLTSTEDEIREKSNLESSSVNKMEDMCFQKVDKPETFKEVSKTVSEDIFKESQNELQNQNDIIENIVAANSSLGTTGKDGENPEPKVDGSFMKLEESILREGEELAPTEASTREYRDDEGFTVVVGEYNVEVEEHSKSETSKHEGHPQQSFLLKSEPEMEDLESPLDVASEEIETTASNEHAETITHVEEQRLIESLEENLEETRKGKTINADDINKKEIPEEKTLSTVDLDKKTVSAEVEIPNKNANDLYVTHPLVEETSQVGGEKQDKVSTSELEERVHEANRVPTKEEKHVNEAYEASKSSECTILEHTSTEEAPEAELTTEASKMEVDNLEKVCGMNSEEKLQVTDAGDNIKEAIKHKEAASDTELQRITAKSEEEVPVKDSDTTCTGEEADQLNCQKDENKKNNSEEAALELNGGDQSCRTDNEMENIYDRIINEEVYEGPQIAEMDEDTEKQIKNEEHTVTDHSTESTGEETTKCSQEDETEAEKSKAEMEEELETTSADEGIGIEKQVILEENKIQAQPMVSIEEETNAESSKEDEMTARMIKQEVLDTTNRGQDFLEQNVKEIDCINDRSTESFEDKTVRESSQEDEASEGYETAGASTNRERQNIEESAIIDLPTLTVGEEKVEEEVKELNIECIEQNLEVTHPTEETKPEATRDEAEPNKDCYTQSTTGKTEETRPNESNRDLVENSSSVPEPEVSEKDIEEEILEKAESTEETSLKEAEAEDKIQVDSSDLAAEEKGLVTIETSESRSDGADILAKPTETNELGENKDMENPTARKHETDEAGEKIEHQVQNGTHYTLSKSEDQREVATGETLLDDILEQRLKASSTLSLKEHNLMTTKTSETTDETPEKDEAMYAEAETPLVVEVTEEKLMQKEMSANPRDDPDMGALDIGKESINEEVQDEDQKLYMPPQPDNEKSIFESDVELGSEIGKLETLKDEKSLDIGLEIDKSEDVKPVDEASKCAEACATCADTEKDIQEQEHSVKNFEGGLEECVEIEKAVNELEAGGHSHGSEAPETRSISTATKENLESVEPGEELKCASESLPEDQSNKTFPQTNKTKIDEESNNVKDQNTESTEEQIIAQDFQEGKKKMNEEMEPKAEDQSNKTQDAKETTQDVILTEEVPAGVERADDTENIKEQIIEEESCTKELHTMSIPDATVNEVKEPDLEPNENLEATDSNVDTETVESKVAEDLNWGPEASPVTKASEEEMKKSSQKPVDVTSSVSEVSEENTEVADNCNEKVDTTPTVVTEETSLEEVQQDKSVKAFDTSSDTKSPETTETTDTCPQGEEVDSVKLEETSGMVSQLPTIEDENADKSVNLKNPDADEVEVEETKTSDVVSESKYQYVEEIHETGIILTVGSTDTDEIEEEIKEVPETISKPRYQGVEAVTDGEITPDQTLPAEKLEEQLQVPSSALLFNKQETMATIDKAEDEGTKNYETELDSMKLEETSGMVPQIPTIEQKNADNVSVIVEKLDSDEVEETNTFDALCESKNQGVEEIHESETIPTVRKIDTDKIEELLKEVPETISEPRYRGVEAVTDGEITPDQTLPAGKLEEQLQVPSSALLSKEQDHETMATIEKIEDEHETTNKDETEVDSMKLDETSGIVSQLPTIEWENVDNVSVTVEKSDANDIEVEKPKTSEAECKSKDQGAEIHETETSRTLGKTDTGEMVEEIKEVPETISEPKYQSVEAVTDGEITLDQTLAAEKLEEQLQVPSSVLLSMEQDHETKTTTEKIANESTKKDETEVDSMKLEETSGMVSQIPTTEWENADDVSVTVAKLNADEVEVEETKTSDAVCESKDQGVEEIHETGTSLTAGKADKDEMEEEIKEVPETISEPRCQGIDTVTDGEITPDQTFPAGILEEQLQVPSSALFSRENDQETMTTTKKMGEQSTKKDETEVDSMKLEETVGMVSQLPTIERENANIVSVIVEKLDADEVEETETSDAVCKSKDQGVEEIHETGASPTLGKIDTDEKEEEIKEVPETISEPGYQGVEAATDGENTLDQTLPAGILKEKLQVQSSALLSREQDHETMTITEQIENENTNKDETEVDSMKLKETYGIESQLPTIEREKVDIVSVTVEKSDADEETKISDTVCESKDQGVEEIHETGTSPTVGKTGTDEMEEEIKEVPQTISEPKYKGVEEVADGEITPDQTLPAGILEEKLQVPSSVLLSKEQGHEIMATIEKIEDESTNKDDTQVNKNLDDSFATGTTEETCLQKEELRELEVSKTELKLIEGIQKDSTSEASKEKSTALEEVSAIEPQEYVPEIKYADSPSESEKRPMQCNSPGTSKDENILDSGNSVKEVDVLPIPHSTVKENLPGEVGEKCEETSNLEFEKTGKVLESVSEVHSPEVLTKPEETKIELEQLKAAITELSAEEDQSEETTEANETIKNEISSEEITEEKDVAKDSHLVSPDEETVAKSNQEDELRTEEYPAPGEKIDETIEITKDRIPNEELSEELEKAGVYKNIKEMITGDDRAIKDAYQVSVGDGEAIESLPEEEREGKNVEKAPIEFNIENRGDETNGRDTVTEAMALSEEVNSSKVDDEDRKGADDKETVIREDEEVQNTILAVPSVTDAAVEEAPDKNVGEKIEEVSELASKEPIQIIETYEENKEIAMADRNNSESLMDDEKPKHTSPKSAYEVSDITEGLNLKEQEVYTNEPSSLPLTETSQKEIADKDSENKVEEKQCDFILDKQTTDEVSITEGRKSIKCEGEHRKDEEPLKLSTRGNERKLDEAEIHSMVTANEERETQVQNEELNVLGDIKDSGMGISQKDGIVDLAKGNEITKDIQELEKTMLVMSNEQIPREEDPNKSTEATISTGSNNVPLVQQDKTAKTFQSAEVEDLKTGNASWAEPEAKGVESGQEKRMDDECEETTEKSTSIESAEISLSDHLQGSTKENSQVAKHLAEEGELMVNKEELQTEKAETAQVEEAKTDEEDEGDEHKRADSGSDAPVMVEASRDMDVKIVHKKSHSILSGVGSKVKHSIAKVKKVITGKSSHPKSLSPK